MTPRLRPCRISFTLLALLGAAPGLAGCDKHNSSDTTAAATTATNGTPNATAGGVSAPADAGRLEPGVLKGTARDASGRPLKSFAGYAYGYSLKSGQTQSANFDGADGRYRVNTGPGQFATRAWTDVEYNGHQYRIDLCPADGKGNLTEQDTSDGLVKDFVWRLGGFRPGVDERSDDRFYGHFGGSIMLYAEGDGATYHENVLGNYQAKPDPKVPADSTVEVTLTPDGPLIDGSAGQPVVLKTKPADVHGYMDRLTRGIPIGRYKATARELTAAGQTKPLRVAAFDTFHKTKPVAPAESITVEFIQSKPPSDNVNGVDEINLLAMY
jgi:hypothetical protein